MKIQILTGSFLLIALAVFQTASAEENHGYHLRMGSTASNLAAGCTPATAQVDLDINNVRGRIMNGGDMWWDLNNNAKYEIPKGSAKMSLFAGALWIGGVDAGGQLKVAAMTYRQNGNDFWPGPINGTTVSVDPAECTHYDKIWKITRKEVEDYVNGNSQVAPVNMTTWPGNGNAAYGEEHDLAPYFDKNGDGVYNYADGDYPNYNLLGLPINPQPGQCATCTGYLFGDETLWWVFNDVGNIHLETGAQPIGLEIQAQGFGFSTNDEINNMTFYQYKIINRSTYSLNETYFGQWVDPDLGNATDDYVGCDVARGLGYCYNGDADDEGANGYGTNPPAVGVDFFQGPIADANDGVDNNKNCTVDETCEQIIMSKFLYYNNDFSITGNPQTANHYYNFLKGYWKDGTPFTYGANGYGGATQCSYMFPGDSDPYGWGLGGNCSNPVPVPFAWTEAQSGNTPGDRRFLQSAGKFTLQPGAVNYVTTGVVWARASSGGPQASIELMKKADDKAQALFDNCFKVLNGPDAPDMAIREMDKELVLSLSNSQTSNNANEGYTELDPLIICDGSNPNCDRNYHFQGYQIFQLKDATVTISDIHNPDKARLVAECDIKDGVTQMVNYYFDASLGANVPVEEVNGTDAGIIHTFRIVQDQFATGNSTLINHKQYFFTAISYGYNNFKTYNPSDPNALDGQKRPYFAGRRNVKNYVAVPHIPSPENGGQALGSSYGNGPKMKRVEGQGNGSVILDFTQQTINDILSSASYQSLTPVYENAHGPARIKVYDPVKVPSANFKLIIKQDTLAPISQTSIVPTSRWTLINMDNQETVNSEQTIAIGNEQLIPKWGMSLAIVQPKNPGADATNNDNAFLDGTMTFTDPTKAWLSGAPDQDGEGNFLNWIHSGTFTVQAGGNSADNDVIGLDPNQNYEKVLGGTWAPYKLTSTDVQTAGAFFPNTYGPRINNSGVMAQLKLDSIASVDVVFTDDKSKWTRCVVVETSADRLLAEGSAYRFWKRVHQSVDQYGAPSGAATGVGSGLGWFPGYALNLETGERLNIIFGENSWLTAQNGRDMLWNPTADYITPNYTQILLGGMHYVYIMNRKYDQGAYYDQCLSAAAANPATDSTINIRNVWKEAMWCTIPILVPNQKLLATDVKIRLRVAKAYKKYDWSAAPFENRGFPVYTFNTADLHNDINNTTVAKNAMDLINIVPNPYYAFSTYEKNQLDSRVKITNLPSKCTVSIYTLNGNLVRRYKRDVTNIDTSIGVEAENTPEETSIDWDTKNQYGIPVASGMYIIHVKSDAGEKILKWFGVMRPLSLDSF